MAITAEEIAYHIQKCTDIESGQGFLYFLLNFVYVAHPVYGKVKMKDKCYDWQKLAAVELLRNKRIISRKQRQVGFSTLLQGYALFRALFFPNQKIVVVSINQEEAKEFLEKMEFIYLNLPVWLRTQKTEDNKQKIKYKNGSTLRCLPNTPNAGRGASLSLLILDEFAEYGTNARKILASSAPALGPGFKKSFSNDGLPSQLCICSTIPEVLENNEYMRIYRQALTNNSEYKIIEPTVHDNEFYADPDWHKMMKEDLGIHAYNREILAQEMTSLEGAFIPEENLNELKHLHPIRMDFLKPDAVDEEGYAIDEVDFVNSKDLFDEKFSYIKGLWIWHDPIKDKEYGLACDVATGRSGDTSTIQVIDLETLEQVAEYQAKPNTEQFKKIIKIIGQYYNNAKICVERNSMGEGICQWLAYGDEDTQTAPYDNFYFERAAKKKLIAGHYTSVGNRANMLATMLTFIVRPKTANQVPLKINSQRTIGELKTFGFDKRGRLTGISNTDDLVMALAQFCYLREIFFLSDKQITGRGLFATSEELEKQEEETRKKHFAYIDEENQLEQFKKMGYHIEKMQPKEVNIFDQNFDFEL